MTGILLLGALLLVAAVMWWLVRNDHANSVAEQKGWFRMRYGPGREVKPERPRWRRRP